MDEAAKRLRNPRPECYVTLHGLPLSFGRFGWPFHESTSGADTSLVHGEVRLEDGGESALHAKIAASMTVTFCDVVAAPELHCPAGVETVTVFHQSHRRVASRLDGGASIGLVRLNCYDPAWPTLGGATGSCGIGPATWALPVQPSVAVFGHGASGRHRPARRALGQLQRIGSNASV